MGSLRALALSPWRVDLLGTVPRTRTRGLAEVGRSRDEGCRETGALRLEAKGSLSDVPTSVLRLLLDGRGAVVRVTSTPESVSELSGAGSAHCPRSFRFLHSSRPRHLRWRLVPHPDEARRSLEDRRIGFYEGSETP